MSLDLHMIRDLREPYCTLGVLTVGGHKLHTMERPWLPNPDGGRSGRRFESCVSDGTYKLEPHRSEKFGNVWALVNPALDVVHWPDDVPRGREAQTRAAILVHAANFWHEVLGCIGPGRARTKVNGRWMVTSSRDALNVIRTVVGGHLDLTLTITWAEGVQP